MTDMAFNPTDEIAAYGSEKLDVAALKSISRRSLFPWLRDALLDWAVIAAALAAVSVSPNPLTVIAAVLIVGNRQHALAVLGHDATHFTLSHSRGLNDFLANVFCFWPLGLTGSGSRALHYAHHKNTGTPNDPELGHKRMRSPQWDLPASRWTVLRYALKDLAGYSVPDFVIIVTFSKPAKKRDYFQLGLFHAATVSTFILLGLWLVPLFWAFCLVTSFMMFFRLRLWLEHQGTEDTLRIHLKWWEALLLAPHNAWYHWEHHKYPTVPYYNLPKARSLLGHVPVMSLAELIVSFEASGQIASGTALAEQSAAF